jgi:hypothetical protein
MQRREFIAGLGAPMQTTPAEDKATVQGAIAYFGTYTVNEADRSYTNHVDGSSYPNWRCRRSRLCLLTEYIKFLSDGFVAEPNASPRQPIDEPQLKLDALPTFKSAGFRHFSREPEDIIFAVLFLLQLHAADPCIALRISELMEGRTP